MKVKIFSSLILLCILSVLLTSSSHREAPLISNDPLADNTDLYAFRSPENPDKLIIIANYVPGQLPQGGPNYYSFGENIRYEIHIDNELETKGDDVIYRFTFKKTNEDPTTFFNIRLGKQNLKPLTSWNGFATGITIGKQLLKTELYLHRISVPVQSVHL